RAGLRIRHTAGRRVTALVRRLRDTYRRMRLGTRLTLGLGVLSLAVFAVVGTALTTHMHEYLERQLADQLRLIQTVQAKDAAAHGTVKRKSYYGWYTAVYDVSADDAVTLRKPAEVPDDTRAMTDLARAMAHSDTELVRTARIDGE